MGVRRFLANSVNTFLYQKMSSGVVSCPLVSPGVALIVSQCRCRKNPCYNGAHENIALFGARTSSPTATRDNGIWISLLFAPPHLCVESAFPSPKKSLSPTTPLTHPLI